MALVLNVRQPSRRTAVRCFSRRHIVSGLFALVGMLMPRAETRADGLQTKPNASQFLETHPGLPLIGNPAGNLTIVEFYDYRCVYCRSLQPVIEQLLHDDDQLRLVLAPWPVYGALSVYACETALSAAKQNLFQPVHAALLLGRISDQASVRLAAAKAGLDLNRSDLDIARWKNSIDAILEDDAEAAKKLGLHGTPGLLIGEKLVPGALTYEDLRQVIAEARAGAASAQHQPIVR